MAWPAIAGASSKIGLSRAAVAWLLRRFDVAGMATLRGGSHGRCCGKPEPRRKATYLGRGSLHVVDVLRRDVLRPHAGFPAQDTLLFFWAQACRSIGHGIHRVVLPCRPHQIAVIARSAGRPVG